MSIIITGGEGGLAKSLCNVFSEKYDVHAPSKKMLDVSDEESVKLYFSGFDSIDLLICNAGATFDSLLLRMGEKEWDRASQVNLKGAFLCARSAAKKMVQSKCGHILFISSYSAFSPPVGQVNYAAAKSGLIGLSKSLATELGRENIRVNVIVPGWLDTAMTEGISPERVGEVLGKHVLGEFNIPKAVGAFVKTLHDEMPYTSGQVFHLDSRILS